MQPNKFFKKMTSKDWFVSRKIIIKSDVIVDDDAEGRLSKCPKEFIDFICSFESFTNYEENVWFLSYLDFKSKKDEVFPWNEFEKQSLENSDEKEYDQIESFWHNHIPFILSVKDGYSYIAICTKSNNYGKIYQGSEPEYEEVNLIADSLSDFFEKFSQSLITI